MPYNSWILGGSGGRDVGSDMFKWLVNAQMMEERERTRKDGCVLVPTARWASRVFVLMLERNAAAMARWAHQGEPLGTICNTVEQDENMPRDLALGRRYWYHC